MWRPDESRRAVLTRCQSPSRDFLNAVRSFRARSSPLIPLASALLYLLAPRSPTHAEYLASQRKKLNPDPEYTMGRRNPFEPDLIGLPSISARSSFLHLQSSMRSLENQDGTTLAMALQH